MTTPDETRTLLRFISTAMDRPVPPTETAEVWSVLLADVPYIWARDAALDLLKTSPYWPKPADIVIRAKEMAAVERARQNHERQLALGAALPAEPELAAPRGPALIRDMLVAIREANKHEPDRDKRRVAARMVAADFKASHGVAPSRPGGTCTSKTCRCSHTEGCDAGWIETDRGDGVMVAFPCGQCNSRRHTIATSGSTREAAMRALRDVSDVKAAEGEAW